MALPTEIRSLIVEYLEGSTWMQLTTSRAAQP